MQEIKNILKFEECETIEELDKDFDKGVIDGIVVGCAIAGLMVALT